MISFTTDTAFKGLSISEASEEEQQEEEEEEEEERERAAKPLFTSSTVRFRLLIIGWKWRKGGSGLSLIANDYDAQGLDKMLLHTLFLALILDMILD